MNNRQLCSYRDKQIIYALSLNSGMTAEQLTVLYFPGKAGYRKCYERLKYLREHELIQFIKRPFFDFPNVYYLKKEPALTTLDHVLSVSWIFVWLSKHFEIEYWEREADFETLQCDALCKIKGGLWFFVELDLKKSHNQFKKPMKYTELYTSEGLPGSKLLKRLENPARFPRIIIVTDSVRRGIKIKDIIRENNPHKLNYGIDMNKKDEIYLLDEILKEVKA